MAINLRKVVLGLFGMVGNHLFSTVKKPILGGLLVVTGLDLLVDVNQNVCKDARPRPPKT